MDNKHLISNLKYHTDAWLEFVTPTPEEAKIIDTLESYIKTGIFKKERRCYRRAVRCLETGKKWNSVSECAIEMRRTHSCILNAIKCNRAVYKKYHFRYA